MSLLLIRHGETAGNANGIIQHPETPLNKTGMDQATRLANRLSQTRIGLILSSDYVRALETAEKIAQSSGAKVLTSRLLRERNFGKLRGKSYADLGGLDVFSNEYIPPEGESWQVFNARVDDAWEEITKTKIKLEGKLVVITHGLVLRSVIERKLIVSQDKVKPNLVVNNTSVTVVEGQSPWRVKNLAVVDHLENINTGLGPV